MTVVLRLYAYYITVDGSTLIIICRRDQGRIKTYRSGASAGFSLL